MLCRFSAIPLLLLTPPLGATVQQNAGSTIIVKGTRVDPDQARERAVDFVKRTGVANGQQQVARWIFPICVKVFGLTTPQAVRVEDSMLDIAYEANMPVAGPGCQPNITVTFAPDAGEVVRHIYAQKPHQLRELSQSEREKLLNGETPVRWWYATEMMDREGMRANNLSAPWITAGEGNSPVGLPTVDGISSTQQYNSGSNVRTPTVRSLYGATIIVDAVKAGKTPVDAIAAYAAMVAFAEMNASVPPPDSILGLFQPASVETSLTDWDMAFLKSLYRMPLDRRSRIQRGHLIEALLDERLPKEGKTKKP
jgi:hypothetical protein